jgi:hypothetical protein
VHAKQVVQNRPGDSLREDSMHNAEIPNWLNSQLRFRSGDELSALKALHNLADLLKNQVHTSDPKTAKAEEG